MKKILVLGVFVWAFLLVGVSIANAQFVVGDRVQTTAILNVRSSAGGTLLGSQPVGSLGTIVGGPVFTGVSTSSPNSTWWNVNYDISPDGWSIGDYLVKIPSGGGSCADVNKDGSPDVVDVTLVVDVAFRGAVPASSTNTDVNGSGVTDIIDVAEEVDYVFRGMAEPTGCVVVPPANQPPVINSFTIQSPVAPGSMTSAFIRATDPNNDALSYWINWGDGQYSGPINGASGAYVSSNHSYVNQGTYSATSSVYDGRGSWVYAGPVYVSVISTSTTNQPPVINSFTGPTSVSIGTLNTWQALATDPNGNPLTYSFYWGDGSLPTSSAAYGQSGAIVSASRIYSVPGAYTQTLQVWDTPYSGWVSQTRTVTVTTGSSTAPTAPSPKTLPGSGTPLAASVINSLQEQLLQISQQLNALLLQLAR